MSSRPFLCWSVNGKITVPESVASSKRMAVVDMPFSGVGSSVARAAMENGGCVCRSKEPSSFRMPSRKAMEEMCPSPTARSDITTRSAPAVSPD